MQTDQMHIRHCILYEYKKGSKSSKATRNIYSTYNNEAPSICPRPKATDGLNNLNQVIVPSLTPLDQEDPLLLIWRF